MALGLRRLSQILFFILFAYFLLQAVHPVRGLIPPEIFLLGDPLIAISTSISGREFLPNLLYALPLFGLALVAGRAFCGWICPLGTILDAIKIHPLRRPPAGSWREKNLPRLRAVKVILLFLTLASAVFTSAFLLLLDPLSLLTRTMATVLYPLANQVFTTTQTQAYDWGLLPDFWVSLDQWLRGSALPYQQPYYRLTMLFLSFFVGVIALNALAPRFWCRYLCPLGAFYGLVGRLPLVRRRVNEDCNQCGKCAAQCKTGAISATDFGSDPLECIQCLHCQSICPQQAISYLGKGPVARRTDPTRRQFLLSLGAGIVAVSGFRVAAAQKEGHPLLVRPPGARQDGFLARCIRCGQCMKVCPTQGLQPALWESGLEGLWSPMLVSRLGYCDYSCTSCGYVCPTGAIEKLVLESKRQLIIGTAYIDQNRCIPWADRRDCIVCQELCPVPDKAIVLESVEVQNNRGDLVTVKRPRVLRKLCIGCGICEYNCPVPHEAAIRVYATADVVTNTDAIYPITPAGS